MGTAMSMFLKRWTSECIWQLNRLKVSERKVQGENLKLTFGTYCCKFFNVTCLLHFYVKAVNENMFVCILVVIKVKIRIGLRKYLYFWSYCLSILNYTVPTFQKFKAYHCRKDIIVTYFAFVWQISCWYTEYCCPFRACRVYIYDFHATPLKFWKIWRWN